MPFTVSHAAAVLPLQRLTRSRIPLAAMMIGSMSPDFAYFLPVDFARDWTHDFDGVFLFCWPVSLLLWLLFVKVLERPTIEVLPAPWRERVPRSLPVTPRALLLASLGVVIGAITHIAWDSFTHAVTPVSGLFPGLHLELFEFRGRTVRVYGLLQYLSSVAGLVALAYWAYNLRFAPPARAPRHALGPLSNRARLMAALTVIGTAGIVGVASFIFTAGDRFEYRVFELLVNGMIAWVLAWCVVAVAIHQIAGRTRQRATVRSRR